MDNLIFVVKTQNLKNDQRVLKEINSIKETGVDVSVFACTDCGSKQSDFDFPLTTTRIPGGAAPKNLFLRIFGVLFFYIKVLIFLMKNKSKYIWICDPILFGLIGPIKMFFSNRVIIWDHHELPPDWFLSKKKLIFLFKRAYKKSNIVIHCNHSRRLYLEDKINFIHSRGFIISNFPQNEISEEEILDSNLESWINNNNFVYLQNCLQDDRCGAVLIRVLLQQGYKIFHAGKVNLDYIEKNSIDDNNIIYAGYLSYKQINRVLNKCQFTIVTYRMDNYNQIFCDPNRLYQSMNLGVPIIIGNNPSMVEITKDYNNTIILDDDGSIEENFKDFLFSNLNSQFYLARREPKSLSWNIYKESFKKILGNY